MINREEFSSLKLKGDINMFNEYGSFNKFLFYLTPTNETDKALIDKFDWLSIYYRTLGNVLLGLFKYEGLTPFQKKRLQMSYFNSMYVGAFMLEDTLTFAPLIPIGNMNAWGEYSGYNAVLPDGKQLTLKYDDVVVGTNLTMPTICDSALTYKFASLLAELKLSITNNIILSRKSAVLETENPNGVNELLTSFNNHVIGNPITIQKSRTTNHTNVMSFTDITDTTEYYENFRDIVNDFLITTGLSSLMNPNKKERLVVAETDSTNDIKNTLLVNRIENRKQFIEEVNAKFGTDIKCIINVDVVNDVESIKQMFNENSESGVSEYDD